MRRQRIGLTQTQRLQLNTTLQAQLHLLRLDAGGLTRYLEEQAAANPFLALAAPPLAPGHWLPRWESAFAQAGPAARSGSASRSGPGSGPDAAPDSAQPGPSLMAHVLAGVDTLVRTPRERSLALVLAEALEPSGWLGRPLSALAAEAGCPLPEIEAVLIRLQQMEPTGLFARSLAECLRLQAVEAGRLDRGMAALLGHLDLLAKADFARLSRLCGLDEAEIMARLRVIRGFDPKPGAQFDPGAVDAREPDIVVTRGADGWEIALNRSALPALSVNRPAKRPDIAADRAALAQALGLRRMVERRNATLLAVAREVVARQVLVPERGLGALVPLTMADVATALDRHESTVSRVVAGVSLATPAGTFALRSLFAPALGDASPAAVRADILRLIAAENPRAPLTDAALTRALVAMGRAVARRTVAKYREMLRIPVAGARRRPHRR